MDQYPLKTFDTATPLEIENAMERAEVVFFERCPVELPEEADLEFLRSGLPVEFQAKNISYHPESDSIPRFEAAPDLKQRVELVHIDAGAYGATNGARILRFFVNIHPSRDRVWGTKGSFNALMSRHRELWDAAKGQKDRVALDKGPFDRLYSGFINAVSKVYPLMQVIDSSPYDRSMRRIHNYMKENPSFRDSREGYQEIHFPPMSAWMVFTDGISHSVLTGQHALVTTVLIPLVNARHPSLAPFHVLARSAA